MIRKKLVLNYLAILFLFLASGAGTFENAAIQTTIEAWPSVAASSIRLMITLPCLLSMITMIGIGRIVGKTISYRMITIIGSLCIIIGGVAPFFFHPSWNTILLFRVLLGIGVGCYSVRNPLLVKTVPPQQLAKFIGYGNVFGSAMSVIISPLVGHLSTYGWQYAFLSNGFAIVTSILVIFFLKEPKIAEETESESEPKPKIVIPRTVTFYIFMQFFATMALYPLLSGMASHLADLEIHSATIAGVMLSIYTFGGVITNLFLSKIQRRLSHNTLFIALLLPVIGVSMVVFLQNIILIGLGIFISGIGFTTLFSMLQVYNGRVCDSHSVAQASTLILAANQLGIFASSYFIDITSSLPFFSAGMRNAFMGCILVYILLTILSYLFKAHLLPTKKIA